MAEKHCISCKKRTTNSQGTVFFLCPHCSKQEIVRCRNCREKSVRYACPECGFSGPN